MEVIISTVNRTIIEKIVTFVIDKPTVIPFMICFVYKLYTNNTFRERQIPNVALIRKLYFLVCIQENDLNII